MAFKVLLAMLILSAVAIGGVWYTVYEDQSFKVEVTVKDVQQVGDDITLTAVFRLANSGDKPVTIDRVSVSIYTDSSKSTSITSFVITGITIQPGQTVETEKPITLKNIDSVGGSVYVIVDISGRTGMDRFTQHTEREVALS